jgi:hypothetical protein
MKMIKVNNKEYYTNISDGSLIEKCKEFFSTGCESYAISFHNEEKNKIVQTKDDGFDVWVLRNLNMNYIFIPGHAKEAKDGKELLTKYKLDLIELI